MENTQTLLNIILSLITVYLAIKNFVLTSKKDTQRESQELTEIRVQLQQVMSILHDVQKDMRANIADFRALSERIAIIETNLKTAFIRIDELKGKKDEQPGKTNC